MEKGKEGREKGKTAFPNKGCEVLPLPPYPFPLLISMGYLEFPTS
jgi:hypothetical protein